MQTTLQEVLELDGELAEQYKKLLNQFGLDKMDATVKEFEKSISESDGQITNDRIRYFISMFSYYSYALNATLSRHGLRSDVAEFYLEHQSAKSYTSHDDPAKKMTREDKQAVAKLETENEAKVNILYSRVTQAVETRIKAFNKMIETLNMLGAMNMSEAKLGGKQ